MKKITAEKLRKNREHLKYEIDMLCATLFYHLSHTEDIFATTESAAKLIYSPLDSENTEWLIKNAVFESFGIHLRSLHHFIYNIRIKDEDIVAGDYFDDPSRWEKNLPEKSNFTDDIEKVNKEIAHLTEHRLDKTPESKKWLILPIAKKIAEPLLKFIELAPSEFVDPSLKESLNKIIDLPD
jgi:hypothetical protein